MKTINIDKNNNYNKTAGFNDASSSHFFILLVAPSSSSLLPPRHFIKFDENTTDGPMDQPTDGKTRPLIEMRGRI